MATVTASTLPTSIVGHVVGVHRFHTALLDLGTKIKDYLPRVIVLVVVQFYVEKVVQMACKVGTTIRLIQPKFFRLVINLRRLNPRIVCYIINHNIPLHGSGSGSAVAEIKYSESHSHCPR